MLVPTPVATTTIRIRLDSAKIAKLTRQEFPDFNRAFPSGGYFNVDVETMSSGNTKLRLSDEQEYPDNKINRLAEDIINTVYLSLASDIL